MSINSYMRFRKGAVPSIYQTRLNESAGNHAYTRIHSFSVTSNNSIRSLRAMTNKHNLAHLPEAAGMSGKELIQAMIEGRVAGPSMANTMSFRLVQIGDGFAIFEGEP